MELLLELRHTARGSTTHVDLHVDVDPEDTVAALTEALCAHARQRGWTPTADGTGLARAGSTEPLDPSELVVDTGIVSGETVVLVDDLVPLVATEPALAPPPPPIDGSAPPPPPPPFDGSVTMELSLRSGQASPRDLRASGGLTLDVTAGPGVGRVVPLRRDMTVGRGSGCSLTVDDPTMSREHFAVQMTPGGRIVVIPNPTATNGTRVAGVDLYEPREIEVGEVIEAGSSVFVLRSAVAEETRRRDRLGQVPFNRVPYRRTVVWPQQLDDVPAPPAVPTPSRLSLVTAFIPVVGAGALAYFTGNYIFLCLAGMSPIMVIHRHISTKRGGKRRYRREKALFHEQVARAEVAVHEALAHERQVRLAAAPDLAELARQAMLHQPRLWERDRIAGDLLDLRLGLGEVESQVTQKIAHGGDMALAVEGADCLAHQRTVNDVPITVDLLDVGLAGVWGDPAQVTSSGRAMVAQAACLHSPEDLVVVAALGPDSVDGFEWLKWLPHVRSATSPLEGDHLAVGPDATNELLANLLAVAADRNERRGALVPTGGGSVWPRVLLILEESAEPDRALLSQLLDVAPGFGIHAIWLGSSELQVPRQCRATVSCPGKGHAGQVRFTDPSRPDRSVELDGAEPATASSIARSLAPMRDASASSQTTAIPRVVPLFDVLGMDAPTPEAIADRWRTPGPYGLGLPIGLSAHGVLHLDLVEQGPHALIGGTSGAGKSELLQSLVLGLATNHSPERVNFLFVDYKGGASSAQFRDLPHTVGYVTNLGRRTAMRALTSLRAELQRRMALMEGKAKDLAEMLVVAPDEAPASLVIVVDEFAALSKEIPDFVSGIVDIAQRGRSLGVHLILATQRPTGVVNDNILANTNLRIALRMLDPADSNNVIGTRDAADIPVPLRGRAYARVGPKSLVPFQAAWSGASANPQQTERTVAVAPFVVVPDDSFGLAPAGPHGRHDGPSHLHDNAATAETTQLEVLVDLCIAAAERLAVPPARRPWLEPLPDVLTLESVLARTPRHQLVADPGRILPLGLVDDPENQSQHVATVDLESSGGLAVFGTGGSGKTTLLRSLAVGLARQGDADAVRLYVLDFASRSLDQLADLPQVATVIRGDEIERTCRLITLLEEEVAQRRRVLADHRAENLGALRRQPGSPSLPRIVLLLDGYGAFHSTFDRTDRFRWNGRFQQLVATGRQVGVHTVLTNDRRMGVSAALQSALGARLALRMGSPEELGALGVPTKLARDAELPDGRGFLNGSTEVQIASVSSDPSALGQSEAIAGLVERLRAATAPVVPDLPDLPTAVSTTALDPVAVDAPGGSLAVPLGLADLSLRTMAADLRRQGLVVMGPPLSGKSTALATLALGLASHPRAGDAGTDVQLCALGSATSPLRELDIWDDAAFEREGHGDVVQRLVDIVAASPGRGVQAVLFVDAVEDVDTVGDVAKRLEQLARTDAVRMVVASESATMARAYTGWLSHLRRNRSALLLQPEGQADVEGLLGIRPDLRPNQDFPPGRGIFVADRRWQLVQVAQPVPADQRQTEGADPLMTTG